MYWVYNPHQNTHNLADHFTTMDTLLLILSLIGYSLAIISKFIAIKKQPTLRLNSTVMLAAIMAIFCQASLLHRSIDLANGQNLSMANLFSLITWLASLLLLIADLRKTAGNLCLLVFPLTGIAMLLAFFQSSHSQVIIATNHHLAALWHVLLSTLVVSVLIIAGLQAILLAIQEKLLQKRHFSSLLSYLPSLQIMEQILFRLILLGFIGLSLLIITSLFMIHEQSILNLWQKIIATAALWLCFAALLSGRYWLGWRGNTAVIFTSTGVALAILLYLGSQYFLR